MNKAYLLTGGNIGNRAGYLKAAEEDIARFCGSILKKSSLYETAAWGKTDQRDFLNQVMLIDTGLFAHELMQKIIGIETNMGRTRSEKYGARIIDIDIIFFNDEVIHEPALIIPHPQMHHRRFVLEPMSEIAPEFVHPVFLKKISTLLKECGDKLNVKRI
jgi:2-amino-4-hydroxy-6-hydroxymethyldihydropteridine diphosphokinase